jgi:hypothetical protein
MSDLDSILDWDIGSRMEVSAGKLEGVGGTL